MALLLMVASLTNAHAYNDYENYKLKYYGKFEELAVATSPYMNTQTQRASKLAQKILQLKQLKDKRGEPLYELKYRNMNDLFETCLLICANENRIFTRYHIAAVLIQESKLDRYAFNKRDGGKGIAMVMQRYWEKELPWYTNEYDKTQSIKACVAVLNIFYATDKDAWLSIRHYNGKCSAAKKYQRKVHKIYTHLSTK